MAEHADSDDGLRSPTRAVIAVCAAAMVVLGSVGGWLGYRIIEGRQDRAQQARFIEAARQGAINLTTIDHATVDEDIKVILESSTSTFHDDFEKRSQPFADVVRKAQSTSTGTVTSAALESRDGDTAQVLVVASVQMTTAGTPEPNPRVWRMRIGVQETGDAARISDVEFVS